MNIPLNNPLNLPPLPFAYDSFKPVISSKAMRIHYEGHHKGYVTTFNNLLDRFNRGEIFGKGGISPSVLEFNFYGHLLHSYYWNSITPQKTVPGPQTKKLIKASYKNLNAFLDDLVNTAANIKGSGWAIAIAEDGYLSVRGIPNHNLWEISSHRPLVVIDAWEHAYYLQHQNRKRSFFENIVTFINWNTFENRLTT